MTQRFNLILTGNILPGHQREAVVLALAKVLDLSETQAQELLSGREWVVKQNIDSATLEKCRAALNSAGGATRVREVATQPQDLPVGKPMNCPCCGHATLSRRGAGDQCRHCGWRDDRRQNEHYPDKVVAGINRDLSLSQARADYAHYGTLDPGRYTPNQVPLRTRLIHGFWALFIMAYCGYGLWRDSLYIPGLSKSGFGYASRSNVNTNFQGIDAWLMSLALVSGALFLVLLIIDHYDRRRNEHHYQRAGQVCFALMAVFMGLAFISQTYREHGFLGAVPVGLGVIAIVGAVLVHIKSNRDALRRTRP